MFRFTRASLDVRQPERKSGYFELFADEEVTINPYEAASISTGIRVEFPVEYFAHIAGSTPTIRILAGVVDSDYRGVIRVIVFNRSNEPLSIARHEKCADMRFIEITQAGVVEA